MLTEFTLGLQMPTREEVYTPILNELESIGIKFIEKVEKVEKKNP